MGITHLLELSNFFDAVWYKTLTPKAGIDRHDQYQVQLSQNIFEECYRRVGIDCHPCMSTRVLYLIYGAMQVDTRFVMHCNCVGTGLTKRLDVFFGLHNHQVHIQWPIYMLSKRSNNRQTKTDIGHKHSIHHIEVHPVSATLAKHS